jgi:hypothetical protein
LGGGADEEDRLLELVGQILQDAIGQRSDGLLGHGRRAVQRQHGRLRAAVHAHRLLDEPVLEGGHRREPRGAQMPDLGQVEVPADLVGGDRGDQPHAGQPLDQRRVLAVHLVCPFERARLGHR